MIRKKPLRWEDKLKRLVYRFYGYFTGNHVFFPLKIRRKSPLGEKITKLLIKIKGLENA